jgi:hypothetical protein
MADKQDREGGQSMSAADADYDDYPNTKSGWAQRWSAEFAYAKEFQRKWHTAGKKITAEFLMRDVKSNDPQAPGFNLNLFGVNVKTQMDMLYNRVPEVSVDRRWADADDDVARVASEMATRMLNADIEEAGEDFSTVMRNCLQDRLIPGLGVARVRYDMQGDDVKKEKADEWIEDCYVPWMDIMWSPARFWSEIRWIAFRTYKNKKELKAFLGKDLSDTDLKRIPFNSKNPMEQLSSKTSQIWNKTEIWEIWSKEFMTVFWYIEGYGYILKSEEDPLQLEGFFPCPPFFIANVTTMEYIPKADYTFAEALYKEINILEERISLLTKAIKVVGVYDKKAGVDLGRLVNETAENKLIPVDAWAVFQERGGIKGSIEILPIQDIVSAVKELQAQQGSRIQQLYEITGMSDILRGTASDDSQVGTNELKARFASVRVQAIQDEMTRFATDLQKLRLDIIAKHFDIETIISRSNMQMTPDGQNPQLLMQGAQFIKDTELSKWRLMIAPESMAMVDYAQLQQERTEYINALGIFLQSSSPIAEKFPGTAPMLMELLKWGLAGFKGSKQIQGVIDRALVTMQKQPPSNQPDPEVQKQQMEMQAQQQKNQMDMQEAQQKHQLKMVEMMMGFKTEMMEIMARMQETHNKNLGTVNTNTSSMLKSATPSADALSLGPTTPQPPASPTGGMGNGVTP